MSVNHSARSRGHNRDIFSIFFNMKVCYVFLLESPHRSDSNEYKQYTIFNLKKKKITLNYPKSAAVGFFLGTQEQVQNSRGKPAISVRATEVLLYMYILFCLQRTRCCLVLIFFAEKCVEIIKVPHISYAKNGSVFHSVQLKL